MQTNRLIIGSGSIVTALLVGVFVNERNINQSNKADLSQLRQNLVTIQTENAAHQAEYADLVNRQRVELIALLKQNLVTIQAENAARQTEYVDLLNRQRVELLGDIAKQHTELAAVFDSQRKILSTEVAASNNAFIEKSTSLQKEIDKQRDELRISIQQQTAVVHRALGKVIPIELPESVTKKLSSLEACIGDEKLWPKDISAAAEMQAELRDLLRQIPPWAEEDLLPRLNAVRWAVQSIQVIQLNENVRSDALEAAADAYANQLSTEPEGGSTNIATELKRLQQIAMNRFALFRRDRAINGAKEQLGMAVMTDGMEAWGNLAEWKNDQAVGSIALELRRQLHSRLLDDEIAKYSDTTKIELAKLDAVTATALRQAGYVRILENVTIQRLRILQEIDATPSVLTTLTNLSTIVEARIKDESNKQRQDESRRERGYQQWALSQISGFRTDFDTAMKRTKPGRIYGTSPDPDLEGVRNSVVNYLLPINLGYLDTAVAVIYRQAFDDGMNKLDGDLQLSVAREDSKMSKKTPLNYLSN